MKVELLSKGDIDRIHEMSLRILDQVGVTVPHPAMLGLLGDGGARVDRRKQLVRIPNALVERSLEQAGRKFAIFGRDEANSARFGYGTRNYNSIAGEALWIDGPGYERRYATLQDVKTASRFGDALGYINIVGAMADPHEIPPEYRCVEVMATMLEHTSKPLHFWYHDRASVSYLNEIMIAVRGDEERAREYPLCYPFLEPISPLRFSFHGIDILFESSRLGLPVPIGPMAQMGASAPMTIAGTIAQENAEILAGICMTQIVEPGTPVCYGGICHAFDMATTQMIFSGPEQAIFGIAMTQVGKHYDLPVYINVGLTDSKLPDGQAGMEAGITLMLGAAAGADIFGHMGISGVDQASSLDILVMQHEVIDYVESVLRQISFSEEDFAVEEILNAGPGGNYLDSIHTAEHFRSSLWFPQLLNRDFYDAWREAGASSLEDRCKQRKEAILAGHEMEPMAEDVKRAVSEIVSLARRNLSK